MELTQASADWQAAVVIVCSRNKPSEGKRNRHRKSCGTRDAVRPQGRQVLTGRQCWSRQAGGETVHMGSTRLWQSCIVGTNQAWGNGTDREQDELWYKRHGEAAKRCAVLAGRLLAGMQTAVAPGRQVLTCSKQQVCIRSCWTRGSSAVVFVYSGNKPSEGKRN